MKTEQLQIRVSAQMKEAIRKRASAANLDMSEWILAQIFTSAQNEFQTLVGELFDQQGKSARSFVFASINDFLNSQDGPTLAQAIAEPPQAKLDAFEFNYLAAMVEHGCHQKKILAPRWTNEADGLPAPYFASTLQSLRLHLLTSSPAAFRKRNLFIDSSVGDRV